MKAKSQKRSLSQQFARDYSLVGLLPLIGMLILMIGVRRLSLQYATNLFQTLSTELSTDAEAQLLSQGEQFISHKARDIAKQIEVYLQAHSEATMAEMQADPYFQELALQRFGDTGYTALHEAETDIVRMHPDPDLIDRPLRSSEELASFWEIFHNPSGDEKAGYYTWFDEGEYIQKYMALAPVGIQHNDETLLVAVTIEKQEFLGAVTDLQNHADQLFEHYQQSLLRTIPLVVGVVLLLMVLTVLGVRVLARRALSRYIYPIKTLEEMAITLGAGESATASQRALLDREDEIGTLARAFMQSVERIETLVATLEERVAERTAALERQSVELQTTADVGKVAVSTLDTERLMWRVARLIQERLDFYHVGFFLLDESETWLHYRAGSGQASMLSLEQTLRLEVGGHSLIGQCVELGKVRVAQNVALDPDYVEDPNLPDTHSEIALPLIARGRIIGVLDVQSAEWGVFSDDVIAMLETMADEVAVALDYVHLMEESRAELDAERRASQQASRDAWMQMLQARTELGYVRDARGDVHPAKGDVHPAMVVAGETGTRQRVDAQTLAIPVRSRDQVLGVARLQKPTEAGTWTDDEIAMMEDLVEQLGVALDSARLYQDTQRAAARERMTGEITARMRESLDIDTVLRTAIRQMGETLGLARVQVRMVSGEESEA